MERKDFIKKSLLAAGATLLSPLFIKGDSFAKIPVKLNFKPEPSSWENTNLTLAWIGHSTVLINFFGKWIITDPVLFERIGIFFFGGSLGPARLTPPALHSYEFPKPDIILLSHAHMDHTDYASLKFFTEKNPNQIDVVTAFLTKDIIEDLKWKSVNVMDWNDELNLQGIRIRANEVKHFGWRFPWERDRSRGYFKDGRSFNSYLLEYNNKKILFGGDTAKTNKFQNLKSENVDIAIMPIGAYNPWKWNHANPEEALSMAAEIGAKYFIPIHTKTFKQSSEPFEEAIDWMNRDAAKFNLKIGIDQIGQTFILNS